MATAQGSGQGATIYSVAELAGVSIASVSRVLQGSTAVSEKTRAKVLAAAEQLNYVPLAAARSLAVRQHEAHGLVLPELAGPYYAELLLGFESRAAEYGQSVVLLLAQGKTDLARALRQLATRVDGLAVLGSAAIPVEAVASVRGSKPVILIAGDERPRRGGHRSRERAQRAGADRPPVRARPRAPAVFVGDPDVSPDVRDRYRGFAQAHESRGLEPAAPVRVPFKEAAGAAVRRAAPRGRVQRRRARLRQRRAGTVDHAPAAGRRRRCPR